MRIAFLNPQGNINPEDSFWTEGPDFGGQLVRLPWQWESLVQNVGHIEQLIDKELLYNQIEETLVQL